jgi:hypothetical protein
MDAKTRAVLATAILLPLLTGGCKDEHPVVSNSSVKDTDSSAEQACTLFADRYQGADTKADRLHLADDVGRYAARSDNGAVAGRAGLVGRSANRGDASWQAAAESLLKACRNAGWKP